MKDISEGVYTLPVLCALERDPESKALLARVSSAKHAVEPEQLAELHARVRRSGGLAKAAEIAADHMELARSALREGALHAARAAQLLAYTEATLGAVERWAGRALPRAQVEPPFCNRRAHAHSVKHVWVHPWTEESRASKACGSAKRSDATEKALSADEGGPSPTKGVPI